MPHVLVALLALVVFASSSARAAPCAGFTVVVDTSPFCTNVTSLMARAITLGCAAGLYCPSDFVTRLQMAAFMNRLGNALFPLNCAPGQIMKWDGLAWTCANDNIGGSGGGGTVTSVAAGTGLQASPNPITGAGAINLAPSYQLPQACANGQVPKSNGAGGWTCQNDNDTNSGGTVTSLTAGSGITLTPSPITTTGSIAVNTTTIQQRVIGSCAVGSSIRAIAADGTVTCQTDTTGPANAFVHNGNAFAGTAVFGTTDNNALDIRVNNSRVMRYEPNAYSPNVIGGSPDNNVTAGVHSATIGGGGAPAGVQDPDIPLLGLPNRVTDSYGTVGGGYGNRAGDDAGTTSDRAFATVGGGFQNVASGTQSVVGGGQDHTASGSQSTVGGGGFNTASGGSSVVSGGSLNVASGLASTVSGGILNTASGAFSAAGGRRAKTQTAAGAAHNGAFVWADSNNLDFNSSAVNEFAARATGGVRFVTQIDGSGNPTRAVRINPNAELEFGAQTRQMLNLWGSVYGIGVQASAMYHRIDADAGAGGFYWYRGGVHDDATADPGAGGQGLMVLDRQGNLFTLGTVNPPSDANVKTDFQPVDAQDVLAKVAAMPITTWRYREDPSAQRHLGPTAQDFRAAFELGAGERTIATVDADGVALTAIQGLNAKVEAQAKEIADLRRLVEQLLAAR